MVRTWTVADFVLVWLGGIVGTGIFFGLGSLLGDGDTLFILGLAGQYVGNLGVLAILRARKEEPDLGLTVEPRDITYVGLGVLLQIVVAILFLPLARLLFPDGQPPQEIADIISDPDTTTLLKLSVFSAAVFLAPLTEELVFRGVLLKAIAHRGRRYAMWVTALVFSVVHVVGLDPDRILASAAVVLPPLFLFGLAQAWLTFRHGRLGPAIFMHSGWNLLAALVLLIPNELLETMA